MTYLHVIISAKIREAYQLVIVKINGDCIEVSVMKRSCAHTVAVPKTEFNEKEKQGRKKMKPNRRIGPINQRIQSRSYGLIPRYLLRNFLPLRVLFSIRSSIRWWKCFSGDLMMSYK